MSSLNIIVAPEIQQLDKQSILDMIKEYDEHRLDNNSKFIKLLNKMQSTYNTSYCNKHLLIEQLLTEIGYRVVMNLKEKGKF